MQAIQRAILVRTNSKEMPTIIPVMAPADMPAPDVGHAVVGSVCEAFVACTAVEAVTDPIDVAKVVVVDPVITSEAVVVSESSFGTAVPRTA